MGNFIETPVVQIQILTVVGDTAALVQYALHILDAAGLSCDDVRCNALQLVMAGVLQYILAHFNCSLMMWDHLNNKVMGNTIVQLGAFHFVDHFIQNGIKPGQVVFGTVGEPILFCHFSSFLLPSELPSGSFSSWSIMLLLCTIICRG